MLFTGVAYSITAFPVLCRILTELKLLDTTVGIIVLSAGVANDVVGWTLLALSVALVNAGSGLTALWILLICIGWALFLLFPVRKALYWLARRTGSIENGPTMFFMTVIILFLFGSAFFTDIIGVRALSVLVCSSLIDVVHSGTGYLWCILRFPIGFCLTDTSYRCILGWSCRSSRRWTLYHPHREVGRYGLRHFSSPRECATLFASDSLLTESSISQSQVLTLIWAYLTMVCSTILTHGLVPDERSTGVIRDHLGLHNCNMCAIIQWQVWWMHGRSKNRGFFLARVKYDWNVDEL